jgi:hypothetical protein
LKFILNFIFLNINTWDWIRTHELINYSVRKYKVKLLVHLREIFIPKLRASWLIQNNGWYITHTWLPLRRSWHWHHVWRHVTKLILLLVLWCIAMLFLLSLRSHSTSCWSNSSC